MLLCLYMLTNNAQTYHATSSQAPLWPLPAEPIGAVNAQANIPKDTAMSGLETLAAVATSEETSGPPR